MLHCGEHVSVRFALRLVFFDFGEELEPMPLGFRAPGLDWIHLQLLTTMAVWAAAAALKGCPWRRRSSASLHQALQLPCLQCHPPPPSLGELQQQRRRQQQQKQQQQQQQQRRRRRRGKQSGGREGGGQHTANTPKGECGWCTGCKHLRLIQL